MASSDRIYSDHPNGDLHKGTPGSTQTSEPRSRRMRYDVLVVGAGFAGIYQLKHLRDLGFSVLLVDNGSDYGGTWFWNQYVSMT